jgi:hypothetical protein
MKTEDEDHNRSVQKQARARVQRREIGARGRQRKRGTRVTRKRDDAARRKVRATLMEGERKQISKLVLISASEEIVLTTVGAAKQRLRGQDDEAKGDIEQRGRCAFEGGTLRRHRQQGQGRADERTRRMRDGIVRARGRGRSANSTANQ